MKAMKASKIAFAAFTTMALSVSVLWSFGPGPFAPAPVLADTAADTPTPTDTTKQDIADLQEAIRQLQEEMNSPGYNSGATPTERPVAQPKVKLMAPTTVTLKGSARQDVVLSLKNVGSSYAQNLLVQASAGGDIPFTMEFVDGSNNISSLYSNNTQNVTLRFSLDKNPASGVYPITLSYTYKNIYDENLTETDTLAVKVDGQAVSAPLLAVSEFSNSAKSLYPGDGFTLSAKLINNGGQEAGNAQVTLDGLNADGVYLDASPDTFYSTVAPGASKPMEYKLKISSKAKPGSYPLTFKVSYRDKDNNALDGSYVYYVNVLSSASSSQAADVALTDIIQPSGVFGVGDSFTVPMNVQNNGKNTATSIKVTAVTADDGAIVPKSASVRMINSLAPGESSPLSFAFSPTVKAKSQNYVIGFTVEYQTGETGDDDTPKTATFSQYVGVNVTNPKADEAEANTGSNGDKISTPKIIIASYACDPILVKAGQQFELSMTFQNTHKDKTISNITANLSAVETTEQKGSVFTPVNGSNTFYIDSIPPKGFAEKKMTMFTVPDADPRTYTILVKFDYQDAEFNNYTQECTIGINVKQTIALETSEIVVPTDGMTDNPVYLNFSLSNTGKAVLNNLKCVVEGEGFDNSQAQVYFGTLAKSSTVYYDGMFTPKVSGPQNGTIRITYEDDAGEQFEKTQNFTINVQDAMAAMEQPAAMGPDGKPVDVAGAPDGGQGFSLMGLVTSLWFWLGFAGVVVIVVVAAVVVRKILVKRRKGMSLDE